LLLDAHLIGLHVTQIARLGDQMLVHLFTVFPCPLLPADHGALIQAKGGHNGLHGAAISQQSYHDDHNVFGRPQPVEEGAFVFGKRLAALMADISPLFLTMDADVTFADSPSCRAVRIVAKLSLWVHWFASLSDMVIRQRMPVDSLSCKSAFATV